MENQGQEPKKKPFRQWWFWVAVVFVVGIIGSIGGSSSKNETTNTVSVPAPSQQAIQPKLNSEVAFGIESGYGAITITNKDSFDWKDCVFSLPFSKTNPHSIALGQSYILNAADFSNDPAFNDGGKQMTLDDATFQASASPITIQCGNGQGSIDNIASGFQAVGK